MSHISFFLPLPYSRLDQVNKAYAECESYQDLSLHWVSLAQVAQPEFHTKYLSAFDFQIICLSA